MSAKKKVASKFTTFEDILNNVSKMRDVALNRSVHGGSLPFESQHVTSVEDELAVREQLRNNDLKQDIQLKKYTILALFVFLAIETIVVFIFMFFQAITEVGPILFKLDEWSFRLVVAATITQITLMLTIAVQYLFPKRTS